MDTTPTEATIPAAQADEILDEDLEIVSMAGRILGTIQGRWEAATAAFNASFRNGLHDELRAAGLCPEPDAETPLADWERDLLNAEAKAAERPFVACKAPDPNTPGWFCGLRLGHDPDLGCSYRPVDQLPASADDEGDEPDAVTFHASDYADKLTFSATPSWLTTALERGTIRGVFKGEDYWYLEVRTLEGVVTAEPEDTIHWHHDGGLLVRSPGGLCKAVQEFTNEPLTEEEPDDDLGRASAKVLAEKPVWCGRCGNLVSASNLAAHNAQSHPQAPDAPERAQGGIITAPPTGIVITQPDPVETYKTVTDQIREALRRQGGPAAA